MLPYTNQDGLKDLAVKKKKGKIIMALHIQAFPLTNALPLFPL